MQRVELERKGSGEVGEVNLEGEFVEVSNEFRRGGNGVLDQFVL